MHRIIRQSLRRNSWISASAMESKSFKHPQSFCKMTHSRRTEPFPLSVVPRSFSSTALQEDSPPASKSHVTRKRKDPILVTPAAASRIKELLASPNGEGSIGIRLGVKRRGCNGLSYTLNYAFQKEPNEEVMESHGVTIFIEPMALFNVVGTVMDWEETDMSSEFTFQNPNSKGECGCGESFNV